MLYQGIIGGGSSPVEPVDLSPVLLWTNSNPGAEFAAQTVSLDLTDYAGVIIEINANTNTSNYPTCTRVFCKKSDPEYFGGGAVPASGALGRTLRITNEGVFFGNGFSAASTANGTAIPTKIYGVKEYVVEPVKPIDATICERAYSFPATSGTTNTWTVDEDGLYLVGGAAPGLEDSRGSLTFIGEATLISGSDTIRVFTAKAGAQVNLIVSSGNTFTPYVNRIK